MQNYDNKNIKDYKKSLKYPSVRERFNHIKSDFSLLLIV